MSAALGVSDGAAFAVWPVVVMETFGTSARYGLFFFLYNSALGFGSLAFNGIAGAVYASALESHAPNPDGTHDNGTKPLLLPIPAPNSYYCRCLRRFGLLLSHVGALSGAACLWCCPAACLRAASAATPCSAPLTA
jgi:hypothetical protein